MTIEVFKPKKPFIVPENSTDWINTAILFMKVDSTIGPDRVIPLNSTPGEITTLHTSTNPATKSIDTIGKIVVTKNGQAAETIPLDAEHPIYVCSKPTQQGIAVEQIIRYKPFKFT